MDKFKSVHIFTDGLRERQKEEREFLQKNPVCISCKRRGLNCKSEKMLSYIYDSVPLCGSCYGSLYANLYGPKKYHEQGLAELKKLQLFMNTGKVDQDDS